MNKHFKVHLVFNITVGDLTPETIEDYISGFSNADELRQDPVHHEAVAREGRLLKALMEDDALLRKLVAFQVVDSFEGVDVADELDIKLDTPPYNSPDVDLFDIMEPAILKLSSDDAEYFKGAQQAGVFLENTELVWRGIRIELADATLDIDKR